MRRQELTFLHFQTINDKITDFSPVFRTDDAGVVEMETAEEAGPVVFLCSIPEGLK